MKFEILANAYERMSATSSRIELTSVLVDLMKKTPISLIAQVCYLTQGKLYPDFEGIELGVAEKTAAKAVREAHKVSETTITSLLRKTGDLGDVASALSGKSRLSSTLSVEKVYATLDEIARVSGAGSNQFRTSKIAELLNLATRTEGRFLIRLVTGKLRLGVADYTLLDALAVAHTGEKKNRAKLERAYNLCSDLGYVAKLLASKGIKEIERVKVTAGKPVRPMLAERMPTEEAIIEKMNYNASAEYKLDGERVQAHRVSGGEITLFSRRLEKITNHFPDVVGSLHTLPANRFIVEGEIVAIGSDGKYLPFQELMHRRRKYGREEAMQKYPVSVNLFDVLLIEDRVVIDEPYVERRKILEKLCKSKSVDKRIQLVVAGAVKSAKEIDSLMNRSLAAGCEGLVVKDLHSPYRAGAREFAWIKFKPEYRAGVRDTLDLVIVGANYGRGRRAGAYGAFLLAAYDQKADMFRTTTKVGTGFSDRDFENFAKILSAHETEQRSARVDAKVKPEVWFEPAVVIEVLPAEITLSPIYTAGLNMVRKESGFALRFPKFTGRIRDDKAPEDATTVKEIYELYQKQIKHV